MLGTTIVPQVAGRIVEQASQLMPDRVRKRCCNQAQMCPDRVLEVVLKNISQLGGIFYRQCAGAGKWQSLIPGTEHSGQVVDVNTRVVVEVLEDLSSRVVRRTRDSDVVERCQSSRAVN